MPRCPTILKTSSNCRHQACRNRLDLLVAIDLDQYAFLAVKRNQWFGLLRINSNSALDSFRLIIIPLVKLGTVNVTATSFLGRVIFLMKYMPIRPASPPSAQAL